MNNFKSLSIACLIGFLLLFISCQSADPLPTPTPPNTPTPEPPPTATPDPFTTGTAGYPWWNDLVFYEIFVRSFYDTDGDGIGDINGVIEKLDYLNDGDPSTTDDLGVTGIWLMPITVSPSYHGYDVTDYFQIDPEYGTNDDFKRLMEEAHRRGIRVIVDLVMNHTSVQHPWFEASKDPESDKRDWYIWEDENPGFRGPWGQEVWHATRGSHYYGVFWVGMPDLNYENPEVTEAMYGIVDFWLTEMEADGFRLDAIKHMVEDGNLQENTFGTHDWLEDFYAHYKSVEPDAFTVGEAWTSTNQVVDYTGDEVDVAFQFDLAEDVLNSVDVGLPQLYDKSQQEVLAAFESNQYATFITNHDQNRVMSEFDGDFNKGRLAASLLLTTPGIPFVYYGEEIGMTGVKPDEDIRLPMHWSSADSQVGFTTGTPWRPAAQDFSMTSVALQADDPNSLLSHYRNLIHLRNENAALRVGEMSVVESNSNRIYAFLRHLEDEVLLVVMNFDDEPVTAGDYALSLAEGPLTADMTPRQLFGNRPAADLPVSSAGGFEGYIPFEEIPSQSLHIISLQ